MGALSGKKILVTGATGYLGSSIGHYLKKLNLDVTYGSRFKVGKFNEENKTILTDWNVDEINFTKGYDVIINAAGPSARACMADPNHAIDQYRNNNKKLIDAVISNSKKKSLLIQLSTVHIYGETKRLIIDENSNLNSLHPYAYSRVDTENYFMQKFHDHKIDGAILRLGNCFGTIGMLNGEGKNVFINELCNEAKSSGTLTIKSNPYHIRDFVPIGYLLEIIMKLITQKKSLGLYNVVTGQNKTLLQVANEIAKMYSEIFNKNLELRFDKNQKPSKKKVSFDNKRCAQLRQYNANLYNETLSLLLKA